MSYAGIPPDFQVRIHRSLETPILLKTVDAETGIRYFDLALQWIFCRGFSARMVRELTDADEAGMEMALAEARAAGDAGEVPVGAVILRNGEVVGRGQNRILRDNDPTAHAEMLAIRSATSRTGMKWLTDCVVYVTLEPCAMCAGALVLARVSRLVFGADDPKTGACGSLRNVVDDERLNHRIDVRRSVLKEPCSEILKRFFQDLRRKDA